MSLISGVNHVAIVTADLDRFIEFYVRVIGLELIFREDTPAFRHAILRSGDQSWLHPVEVPGSTHGAALGTMFERGHLDHMALSARSQSAFDELRARLIACGASDGVVESLGAFQALWFTDPDGMRMEITLIVDPALGHFHAPRRLRKGRASLAASIERMIDPDAVVAVDDLLDEYVPWVARLLIEKCGVRIGDIDGFAQDHHAAFRATMPQLLGGRGRLLVARLDGVPAGVVALMPHGADVGEVKRMFVRPQQRGSGIARTLMEHLIAQARAEGYRRLRLETLYVMLEARALYRTLGFVETAAFEGSQADEAGVSGLACYMELDLSTAKT